MNLRTDGFEDIEMNPSQLCRALNIPLIDLEPFILSTMKREYLPTINEFYRWLTELINNNTEEELLQREDVSMVMLLNLINDTQVVGHIPRDVSTKIHNFVERELNKIVEE